MSFNPKDLPDLANRVYIVTGATSGIGLHTAIRLAEHNAHVYICARAPQKATVTIDTIRASRPDARISALVMDHTSLPSVKRAAEDFLSRENKLHGLVNNAGIMATPFAMTKDGYEAQWQTNYLAHWLFTHELLPVILATSKGHSPGTCRIVNLSSSGHLSAPKDGIHFADTSLPEATGMVRYGQSKLANVLHMKTLGKLYGPGSPPVDTGFGEIWVSAVHPGLVKSQLGDGAELPWWLRAAIAPYKAMGGVMDPDRGSWTSVYCVASPAMERHHSGAYFQRIADPNGCQSGSAKDPKLAETLEDWTRREMKTRGLIE